MNPPGASFAQSKRPPRLRRLLRAKEAICAGFLVALFLNSFSPLFRLGFTLFPEHQFSLQADIAYIGYANTSTSFGQTFDLGFAGVVYRTLATVRL